MFSNRRFTAIALGAMALFSHIAEFANGQASFMVYSACAANEDTVTDVMRALNVAVYRTTFLGPDDRPITSEIDLTYDPTARRRLRGGDVKNESDSEVIESEADSEVGFDSKVGHRRLRESVFPTCDKNGMYAVDCDKLRNRVYFCSIQKCGGEAFPWGKARTHIKNGWGPINLAVSNSRCAAQKYVIPL